MNSNIFSWDLTNVPHTHNLLRRWLCCLESFLSLPPQPSREGGPESSFSHRPGLWREVLVSVCVVCLCVCVCECVNVHMDVFVCVCVWCESGDTGDFSSRVVCEILQRMLSHLEKSFLRTPQNGGELRHYFFHCLVFTHTHIIVWGAASRDGVCEGGE